MSKVGINNAPLDEVLIYGDDGSVYRPVKVNTSGDLLVALASGEYVEVRQSDETLLKCTVTLKTGSEIIVKQSDPAALNATVEIAPNQEVSVKQATPANLNANVNVQNTPTVNGNSLGWFNSGWYKNPLQFGFSGVVAEAYSNLSISGGNSIVTAFTVDADKIYVINHLNIRYDGTVPSQIMIGFNNGVGDYFIHVFMNFTSTFTQTAMVNIILDSGYTLRIRIIGGTAGDTIYFYATGYSIDKVTA